MNDVEIGEPSDVAGVLNDKVDRSLKSYVVLVREMVDISGSIDEDVGGEGGEVTVVSVAVSRIVVIGVVDVEIGEPSDDEVTNALDANVDRALEGLIVLVCEMVDVSGSTDEDVV